MEEREEVEERRKTSARVRTESVLMVCRSELCLLLDDGGPCEVEAGCCWDTTGAMSFMYSRDPGWRRKGGWWWKDKMER
jgi:hypothetical protein